MGANQRIRIAVDAMGGDYAPGEIVEGAILAVERGDVEIALVGHCFQKGIGAETNKLLFDAGCVGPSSCGSHGGNSGTRLLTQKLNRAGRVEHDVLVVAPEALGEDRQGLFHVAGLGQRIGGFDADGDRGIAQRFDDRRPCR